MAYANSSQQRGYVQVESAYGTIPHSSGTATVGNGDAFRSIALTTDADRSTTPRPDKTGTLSATVGNPGRKQGNFAMRCSLAGNGAAGTEPDIDAFLESLFGKAKTISAGVSVTYALDDLIKSLAIFNYRTPSTVTQQIAHGAVVDRARLTLGEDVAEIDLSGPCQWVLDDDEYSTADTTAKGGLTSFPAEPGSPVTNGNMAIGFTGLVTLDGNPYGIFRKGTIDMNMQTQLDLDVYNNFYAPSASRGIRDIGVEFSMYDDDSANLSALKVKAKSGTPIDLSFQVGTVAGNIWTPTLKNVVLEPFTYDDSARRYGINIRGKAHASSLTAKDEITLVLT